jgi:hypothetical protein
MEWREEEEVFLNEGGDDGDGMDGKLRRGRAGRRY